MCTVDYIAHNSLSFFFFFNRQHISSTGQIFYLCFNLFFPAYWGKDIGVPSRLLPWQCFKLQVSDIRLKYKLCYSLKEMFFSMFWLLILSNGVNNCSMLSGFLTSQFWPHCTVLDNLTFSFLFSILCLLSVSFNHLPFLQLTAHKSLSVGTVSVCLFFKTARKVCET